MEICTRRPLKPRFAVPLLFVPEAWHGPSSFLPWMDYLTKAGFTTHAVNLLSSVGQGKGLRALSHRLGQALEQVGDRPIVVAHGLAAQLLLIHLAKGTCRGAVLLAPWPPWGLPLPSLLSLALGWGRGVLGKSPFALPPGAIRRLCFDDALPESLILGHGATLVPFPWRTVMEALLPPSPVSLEALGEKGVPLLVMACGKDQLVPPEIQEGLAFRLKADFACFPPSGHDPMAHPLARQGADEMIRWIYKRGFMDALPQPVTSAI